MADKFNKFIWESANPRFQDCFDFDPDTLDNVVRQLAEFGLSPRGDWYRTPFVNALTCSYHGGYIWSLPFMPVGVYKWDEDHPVGGTLRTNVKQTTTAAQLRKKFPAKRNQLSQPNIWNRSLHADSKWWYHPLVIGVEQ